MNDLNRILWACRRGMLECDLFLIPFAKTRYSALNATEQENFQTLLALPDQTLYRYLMGAKQPDNPELRHIIAEIQHFKQS